MKRLGRDHRLLRYDPFRRNGCGNPHRQDHFGGFEYRPGVRRINTAMRELFLQIVYGRSSPHFLRTAWPWALRWRIWARVCGGQVGTMFATRSKGPRYLEMAEGYVTRLALNSDDLITGYEFVNLGKMMEFIKKGDDANQALEKAKGHYGSSTRP